ncbi:MAG: DegT/DnrJ/EryC1/StrS family aminotransferase [Nanoarchaeota archaeon]
MKINWNEPKFEDEEIRAVSEVLKEGFVTEGKRSYELEEKLKSFLGVKHVILTTSCSAAMFLAMEADKIIRNLEDYEVLVPDLTFIATATSIELAGGKPILVDIDRDNFCISPEDIRRKITSKTKAIIPVHVLGRSCRMQEIINIAEEFNLTIIEDAANALGSNYNGDKLGTLGKMGCFSLQANKTITCGHGGFIVTNDDKYNNILRRLKDFGRLNKEEEFHSILGFNFKFTDIQSAIVLEQLKRLPLRIENLIKQRKRYEQNLRDISAINFPKVDYFAGEVPLYVDILTEKRDALKNYLSKLEIGSRKCWHPLHRNPPYNYQGKDSNFPNSCHISDTCLWLPNGNNITFEEIDYICNKIKKFYE